MDLVLNIHVDDKFKNTFSIQFQKLMFIIFIIKKNYLIKYKL